MRHESHGLYKWSQWRGKARWKTSSRKREVTMKSKESGREKWTEDRARTLTLRTKPALFYSDQNQASKCKTRAAQVRAGLLSNWSFPVCWQERKPVQTLRKTVWRFPIHLNIYLPYGPTPPLIGIHSKKNSNRYPYYWNISVYESCIQKSSKT